MLLLYMIIIIISIVYKDVIYVVHNKSLKLCVEYKKYNYKALFHVVVVVDFITYTSRNYLHLCIYVL